MLIVYGISSVLIALRLVRTTDEKVRAIKKIKVFLTIKLFLNVIVSYCFVFLMKRMGLIIGIGVVILPAVISFVFSSLDSLALYCPVKRIRNLECGRKEYYRQVVGDNLILYLSWIAASLFFAASKVLKIETDGYGDIIIYIIFWVLFNYVVMFIRKYTMKCKPYSNEKLVKISEEYKIEGYKIYEYDGRSRKTANAMVDSFLGAGNIYFSDYLLENLSEEEVKAIYLHEKGHIEKRHILIRNILLFLTMPFMFCVGIIMDEVEEVFHMEINIAFGIILGMSILILYMVFLGLYVSRTQEYGADAYAASYMEDKSVLCEALRKLNLLNDILESEKEADVLKTHPTVEKRIKRIMNVGKEN